jgi:toxin FitB
VSFVVLDTDVASAILRKRLPESMRTKLEGKSLAITFVTVGELTSWTVRRGWGGQRLADLAAWRRHVTRIPYDEAVATTWGRLDARAQARGRPRPINDMWIATCCLVEDVPLATLNRKDFEDFAEHAPADPGTVQQTVVSGRDRYGQQLGCPHLIGNRLTVGLQACDVDLDGLDRPLPAFVDRAATGKASRQGRNGHEVAAAVLGLHHDCVRAHRIHLVTTPPVARLR